MRRDSERRKELQEAEYRNRKEGMETGRTEEERSTGGTAARGEREAGKRKSRRLSSQKQAEADERKRKAGRKARKRSGRKKAETKGSTGGTAVGAKPGGTKGSGKEGKHRWNSCGSEAGKDERKQTESQVPETGKEAWETRRKRRWKAGKPKGRTGALDKLL